MNRKALLPFILSGTFLLQISCKRDHNDNPPIIAGNYPSEIAKILVTKCATAGCHNSQSYTNAANLRLDTWEHIFEGSINGSVIVPCSTENSPLLYFVNTDSSSGPIATPNMPLNANGTSNPLSASECETLRKWVENGAPDANGNIAFASNPFTRQKIYVTQQGCDKLAVIDGASSLIMRYINIGTQNNMESPHCVRTTSTGDFAYVSFLASQTMEQINTSTDQVSRIYSLDGAKLNGSWNILYISPDNNHIATSDWESDGLLALIDPNGTGVTGTIGGGNTLMYPHGIASNKQYDTLFVTAQYGNVVYKISTNQLYYKKISLNNLAPNETTTPSGSPDPHEIVADTGSQYLYITCEGTNEVKVMSQTTNKILQTIPVGTFPQEIAISRSTPYFFVTCMEDANTNPGMKGSVYAVNYNTWTATKINGDFYQPHGITVDDQNGKIYVISTNANPAGPAPHHATSCNGRAGWYSVIDLATLQQIDKKRYQLLVLPYSAATRFH